jgi:4-hydroxy-tetrahydrodipicolinate synthase
MVAAAMKADAAAAERLDGPLAALHRDLFLEANPIPTKWALARMGMIESGIRLPLTELSARHQPAVLAALSTAGVLS